MARTAYKDAQEARNHFSVLLEATEKGESTSITKHGRPVAALVPLNAYAAGTRQQPLTPMEGSGRGLWNGSSVGMWASSALEHIESCWNDHRSL